MKKHRLTSVKHIIDSADQESDLFQIFKRQQQSEDAHACFKASIDPEMEPHISVLSYVKGKLILEVKSSTWAAKLRYVKQDLLSRLRKESYFMGLIGIECVIKSSHGSSTKITALSHEKCDDKSPKKNEAVHLSKETSTALQEQINESTDPMLSERLQRILDRYGDGGNSGESNR